MTKTEQMRLTAWRLRLLRHAADGTRSVAQTCRHFGVSRKTFYKWKRRLAEHGEAVSCTAHGGRKSISRARGGRFPRRGARIGCHIVSRYRRRR